MFRTKKVSTSLNKYKMWTLTSDDNPAKPPKGAINVKILPPIGAIN